MTILMGNCDDEERTHCAERKVAISHQILTAIGLTTGTCIIGTPLYLTISLEGLDLYLAHV